MNTTKTCDALHLLPFVVLLGFGIPLMLYYNMEALKLQSTVRQLDQSLDNLINRSYFMLPIKRPYSKNNVRGSYSRTQRVSTVTTASVRSVTPIKQATVNSTVSKSQNEPTARPLSCNGCLNSTFRFLINNENTCNKSRDQIIKLLIFITSAPHHTLQRKAVRETWLKDLQKVNSTMKYVFLLGNSSKTPELAEENVLTQDIIVGDFNDAYANLTWKTLFGLYWIKTYCNQAQFIFKTDDDMYVNIKNLEKSIDINNEKLQTSVGGNCNLKAKPIRDRKSKWYVSYQTYPQTTYPGFCSGTGYVTSLNMATKILEISKDIPFFYLEDVYVSLCVHKLGYKLLNLPGFRHTHYMDACFFKGDTLVTAHGIPPSALRSIWEEPCNKIITNNKS